MKNKIQLSLLLFLLCLSIVHTTSNAQLVGSNFLDINNIKATVNADGSLFNRNSTFAPGFEVPQGSGKHSVYASGLWIGGYDSSGALHTACQTYKQVGNDFVYGPTPVNPSIFTDMNKVWKVNRSAIDDFLANQGIPNYIIPQEIIDWPGNYGTAIYAPFFDFNNNGIYEPVFGDYPTIKGDQAVYFAFNDVTAHTESNGLPLNIQIHGMAYAYNNPAFPDLNNTIFVEQRIKNLSSNTYDSAYISMWNDFDLGNPFDDFIGTDVLKNMLFCYNADSVDEGPSGYGANPPAMGLVFLNKALKNTIGYRNDFTVKGNPVTTQQYYNYMHARYKDGSHLAFNSGTQSCNYIFPGSSDSAFAGQYWAQSAADGFDWRSLASYGPFTFQPGAVVDLEVAYVFNRDTNTSVSGLRAAAANVKYLYDTGLLGVNEVSKKSTNSILVYPNPMEDKAIIAFSNRWNENFTFQLLDASGRVVLEQKNKSGNVIEFNRANVPQGLYLVKLSSEREIMSSKLTLK